MGYDCTQNPQQLRQITLTLTGKIHELAIQAGVQTDNPVVVPYGTSTNPSDFPNKRHFQALVGSLLFVNYACRPDITFQINRLARAMADPKQQDYTQALQTIR